MTEVLAVALGKDERMCKQKEIVKWFESHGCLYEEQSGFMTCKSQDTFLLQIYEEASYLLFKEANGKQFPPHVFEFLGTLKDAKKTVISLGTEEDDWLQNDAEMLLKDFIKELTNPEMMEEE
jgi:hypothetical protein